MICNLSEAALHLGYRSRSTLQRLVRDGHLEAYQVPGGSREVLLETTPAGRPSLRSAVQALTQIRYDSPLWREERRRAAPMELDQLCDEQLHAYTAEAFSEEVLDAAMAPITAWCDARKELEEVAERANACLDCSAWGAPPWTPDQWQTLRVVLELAD
jgi:hypothetical protein